MPKWTDDQLMAIEETQKGVVVSAAAGSGKTAVLIERTIRLLSDEENKIEADRLLAVTFTKAAANQIREKLSNAIISQLDKNPESLWLTNQQKRLQTAKITTINAFCLEFVKENIQSFEFESNLRILEENEKAVLLSQAVDEALEHFYKNGYEKISMVLDALGGENDNELIKVINDMHSFFESIPFRDDWINTTLKLFESDEYILKLLKYNIDSVKKRILPIKTMYRNIIEKSNGLKILTQITQLLKNDLSIALNLEEADIDCWDELYNKCREFKFGRFISTLSKKACADFSEEEINKEKCLIGEIKAERDMLKSELSDIMALISSPVNEIKNDISVVKKLFEIICEITIYTEEVLYDLMLAKNAVDFSAVEHMTVELLAVCEDGVVSRTPLCEEIVKNKEYKIILLDEFQDVNNLQDLIFKCLSDTDDISVIGKNVFVVGDVKQSIYRFRQANPKLFINARKKASDKSYSEIREITLKKNFRSRKEVVDTVNFIFGQLMKEDVSEIEYTDDEKLVQGLDVPQGDDYSTELMLIDDRGDFSKYLPYSAEHYEIAEKINQLLNGGAKVFDSDIGESGEFRFCRPSDICVISRNNDDGRCVSKALEHFGIKTNAEMTSGYLRSREISVILNILRVLDNPMQDIPLLSVLMSPVFIFTPDDVAEVRLTLIDGVKPKLYQQLLHFSDGVSEDCSEFNTAKKCKAAIKKIKELRFYAASMNLVSLIRKIYDVTDYYGIASAYEDGHQKRANLNLLLEYADEYDKSISGGLTGFIRYIDSIIENKRDFSQAVISSAQGEAVNITTMHGSKGLEYPFVFICNIFKKFNDRDQKKKMIINQSLGVSLKFNDTKENMSVVPLSYNVLKSIADNEMKSEELRLLYVALTRAKDKLFIPIVFNEKTSAFMKGIYDKLSVLGRVSENMISDAVSCGEWLVECFLLHPDAEKLRSHIFEFLNSENETNLKPIETQSALFVSQCAETEKREESVFKKKRAASDSKLVSKLLGRFDFKYDMRDSETSSKLSVSDIAKDEKKAYYYPQIPKFSEEIGKLTASEKGTVTHRFMELCNFEKAKNNLEEEISRLVSQGKITSYQSEGIDRTTVKAFFESEIYNRIRKSKNIMREKQFLVKLSDLNVDGELEEYKSSDGMLQGIADCIFEEDDGYVLLDYKTDRNTTAEQLIENYTVQLRLYKAAFDLLLEKPVKSGYIYSFSLKEGIEVKF